MLHCKHLRPSPTPFQLEFVAKASYHAHLGSKGEKRTATSYAQTLDDRIDRFVLGRPTSQKWKNSNLSRLSQSLSLEKDVTRVFRRGKSRRLPPPRRWWSNRLMLSGDERQYRRPLMVLTAVRVEVRVRVPTSFDLKRWD